MVGLGLVVVESRPNDVLEGLIRTKTGIGDGREE